MPNWLQCVWGYEGPDGSHYYGVMLFRVGISIVIEPRETDSYTEDVEMIESLESLEKSVEEVDSQP